MYSQVVTSENKDDPEVYSASVVSIQESTTVAPLTLSNWKFDLFDLCGDCGSFLTANCCTPCVITRIAGRIRYYPFCSSYCGFSLLTFLLFITYWTSKMFVALSQEEDIASLYKAARLASCLAGIAGLIIFYIVYRMRTQMRRKLNIYGDDCVDLTTTCCCAPCSLAQMSREVEVAPKCCYCDCKEPEPYIPTSPVGVEIPTRQVTVGMIV